MANNIQYIILIKVSIIVFSVLYTYVNKVINQSIIYFLVLTIQCKSGKCIIYFLSYNAE